MGRAGRMGGDDAERVSPGDRIGGSGEAGIEGRNGSRKEPRLGGDGEVRLRGGAARQCKGDSSDEGARVRGGVDGDLEPRSGAKSARAGKLSDRACERSEFEPGPGRRPGKATCESWLVHKAAVDGGAD